MPTEVLDVVDTAVKIGLGATISGITAFFVGRSNHKNEKSKFLLEHRLKTIETATEGFEEYFKAASRFLFQLSGIERKRKDSEKSGEPYSVTQKKALRIRNSELVDAWQSRDVAVAKLRLLSAHAPLSALTQITRIEKRVRDRIVFDNETPEYEEIELAKKELRKGIKNFHKELSDFYKNIGT